MEGSSDSKHSAQAHVCTYTDVQAFLYGLRWGAMFVLWDNRLTVAAMHTILDHISSLCRYL